MAKRSKVKLEIDDKALKKVAAKAAKDLAAKLTRELNALTSRYERKPLDEVKAAVQSTWARHAGKGGSITDPELTQFAEQIQAGGRVEVKAD